MRCFSEPCDRFFYLFFSKGRARESGFQSRNNKQQTTPSQPADQPTKATKGNRGVVIPLQLLTRDRRVFPTHENPRANRDQCRLAPLPPSLFPSSFPPPLLSSPFPLPFPPSLLLCASFLPLLTPLSPFPLSPPYSLSPSPLPPYTLPLPPSKRLRYCEWFLWP